MKVAVTDLAYSEKVQGYIHIVDYHNRSSLSASSSTNASSSTKAAVAADGSGAAAAAVNSKARYSNRSQLNASSKTDYFEMEHSYTYVEYGELRKFSADIKAELIKSGEFDVIQAKPITGIKTEAIYDIIGRIKKGHYPGADYVLFGSVSDISFSDDSYKGQGNGNSSTETFNLTLTAEFSLINTRNYEVIASFSAVGEGSDTKIESGGSYAAPNRAKVVAETSKTLGAEVMKQINEQVFDKIDVSSRNNGVVNDSNITTPSSRRGVTVFQ